MIGEDSSLFREGLAALLGAAGYDVVGKASDAPGALAEIRCHQPDLAILDIRMPPNHTDDGARVATAAREDFPTLPIILLSQHVETRHSVALVATGSFGYLLKDRVLDVDDFLATVERVAAGGSALDPEVVSRLVVARQSTALDSLTPREHEVLALMAEGRTNLGISRKLWLTERTVETHVSNIMSKLGISAGDGGHRRVLAVLAYLDDRQPQPRSAGDPAEGEVRRRERSNL